MRGKEVKDGKRTPRFFSWWFVYPVCRGFQSCFIHKTSFFPHRLGSMSFVLLTTFGDLDIRTRNGGPAGDADGLL